MGCINNETKKLIISLRKEFHQIDENIFISVVKKSINQINELNLDIDDKMSLFEKQVRSSLNDIILENNSLDSILNSICFYNTYETNIKELNRLSGLIKTDNVARLLEFPNINKMIAFIVNHDYNILKEKDIRSIYKNEIILSLVEIYCTMNNISLYIEKSNIKEEKNEVINSFFGDMKKYPRLTKEQEVECFYKIKNGDRNAYNYFFMCNLGLVVSISIKYIEKGIELNDIIQEGCIGLMTAINKFDATKGFRFSTYATFWIKQSIKRSYNNKHRIIRLPDYVVNLLEKMSYIDSEWILKYNRVPNNNEYACQLGISVEKVLELKHIINDYNQIKSLDDLVLKEDSNTSLGELIKDNSVDIQDEYEKKELQKDLLNIMSDSLSEREQDILMKRFGFYEEEKTLESIGAEYGLTRERVRQIEASALKKLRNSDYLYKYQKCILDDENIDSTNKDNNIKKSIKKEKKTEKK